MFSIFHMHLRVSIVWSYIQQTYYIYSIEYIFRFVFLFHFCFTNKITMKHMEHTFFEEIKNKFTWCETICAPFFSNSIFRFSLIWTSNHSSRSFISSLDIFFFLSSYSKFCFPSKFTYFWNKTKFIYGKWWNMKMYIYESLWCCHFAMQHLLHI